MNGEPCPMKGCNGIFATYKTQVMTAELRVRYFRCNVCHYQPEANKMAVPLKFAPARKRVIVQQVMPFALPEPRPVFSRSKKKLSESMRRLF